MMEGKGPVAGMLAKPYCNAVHLSLSLDGVLFAGKVAAWLQEVQ